MSKRKCASTSSSISSSSVEQIEEERREPRALQHLGDEAISRALAAAPAAVREEDEASRAARDHEIALEPPLRRVDRDRSLACARALEQLDDLVVARLLEIGVALAHGEHHVARLDADHLVDLAPEVLELVGGRDRDGEDELRGTARADRLERRANRSAGRDAVIHDDHRATADVRRGRSAAKTPLAIDHLLRLLVDDRVQLFLGHAELGHELVVDVHAATFGDGAHAELGLHGRAELAHDPNVELGAERASHLERDGDAAAREPDHERARVSMSSGGASRAPDPRAPCHGRACRTWRSLLGFG